MKVIKYNMTQKVNTGTWDEPVWEEVEGPEVTLTCSVDYLDANIEIAKKEAWQGEYTIEENDEPDPALVPSQMDIVEAQVAYTAMMTNTLLEG